MYDGESTLSRFGNEFRQILVPKPSIWRSGVTFAFTNIVCINRFFLGNVRYHMQPTQKRYTTERFVITFLVIIK